MIEFIKWCFRDTTSGVVTIIVLAILSTILCNTIHLLMLKKDQ